MSTVGVVGSRGAGGPGLDPDSALADVQGAA